MFFLFFRKRLEREKKLRALCSNDCRILKEKDTCASDDPESLPFAFLSLAKGERRRKKERRRERERERERERTKREWKTGDLNASRRTSAFATCDHDNNNGGGDGKRRRKKERKRVLWKKKKDFCLLTKRRRNNNCDDFGAFFIHFAGWVTRRKKKLFLEPTVLLLCFDLENRKTIWLPQK